MAIKLSIFTTSTRPTKRGDMIKQALSCFEELADEVINVSGDWSAYTSNNNASFKTRIVKLAWPQEFDWLQISKAYQAGYEACTGDWALFADLDFIFHQDDFSRIRQVMEDNVHHPALSFWKYQFVLPDRYNVKSRRVIAINKAMCGDRVKMNGGGDLCQVTFDGKHLTPDDVPEARVPFYNYEKLIKTKEQIMDDVGRMERAYKRHFGHTQYRSDGTNEGAYKKWYEAQRGKFTRPQKHIGIDSHPMFVQDTIKNLKPEQFGYNGFGLVEERVYGS